ncbi:hypothetical protein EYF80_063505 [Liparis tanakae]|uniref:Uncharacterized protein n=1 Tax=Liparis tanakae TaxID=230148 RepID=A0A4Z2EC67_9TELE|nr:hypothetical protein EYF80_063505 [Liparis tanakae]
MRCFSDSMILVTELRWTEKVWKSCGPEPTVSGCCTMTRTDPELLLLSLTDVVDGAVAAAQDEEGAGRVVAADGNHVLVLLGRSAQVSENRHIAQELGGGSTHLPVLGDGVPDPDLPRVAGGDQLVTNEEESLHRHVQTEDACWEEDPSVTCGSPVVHLWMAHRMISVPDATATILSLSPSEPAITLAFSATRSITQSRRGEVNTCCHPVDSFTLRGGNQSLPGEDSELPGEDSELPVVNECLPVVNECLPVVN